MTESLPVIEDKHKRNLVTKGAAPAGAAPAGAPNDEEEIEASRAPLMDHLVELRGRIIVMVAAFVIGFFVCFGFAGQITAFLLHPLKIANVMFEAQKASGHGGGPFDMIMAVLSMKDNGAKLDVIFTAPLEVFFAKVKIAGFGAIIVSFPVLAFQLYRFVAPGLYRRERHAFLPFLFAAPCLFLLGMALVYFIILPMVLWFSLSQQVLTPDATVTAMFKVADYLSLITTLMLAFGVCFQLPIVITLLGLTGIVTAQMLGKFRRYAILAIVVVAAIVTPPDPVSQLMLAIPIILLYEVSIWCVKLIEASRQGAKHPAP